MNFELEKLKLKVPDFVLRMAVDNVVLSSTYPEHEIEEKKLLAAFRAETDVTQMLLLALLERHLKLFKIGHFWVSRLFSAVPSLISTPRVRESEESAPNLAFVK
ncbi:hypothetical protein CDAR_514131 [Caerostris darwini]|uniref:Uncharacterized protein n=1 Tax=Caerostris darwini TaxID=1538125 RepID=A0AAV4UNH0_9ARAC|nr:hypothetical protein CDAR_514131 [Caerostris darwini]